MATIPVNMYQQHKMNDYRPMSMSAVNDWQYQPNMAYENIVKQDETYKVLKMHFSDAYKMSGSTIENPKFDMSNALSSGVFNIFDAKRPIYMMVESCACISTTYTDPLFLCWNNAPFDTKQSWNVGNTNVNSSYKSNNTIIMHFDPLQFTYRPCYNKIGSFELSLRQLQSQNVWEFSIADEIFTQPTITVRNIVFTLVFFQQGS